MSAYVYDIALLIIMTVCIVLGYKRGVLRTILNLICFVIAFAAASALSSQSVTELVYDRYLHETVLEHIETAVTSAEEKAKDEILDKASETVNGVIDESFGGSELMKQFSEYITTEGKDAVFESIPELYDYLGIDLQTLLTNPQISDKIKSVTEEYSNVVADEINSRMPFGIEVDEAYVSDVLSDEDAIEAIFNDLFDISSESAEYSGVADYLEQTAVRPACIRFLEVIIWAAAFAFCSFVLHIIVSAVLTVRKIEPIKVCDSILGAVAGAAAGAVVVSACCMIIVLAVRLTGGTEYMNEDIFSNTLVFGRIYSFMTEL